MSNSIVAPATPLEPIAAAARGDQSAATQSDLSVWQPDYINQDPNFVREVFDAMQPTGCWDTDMQNLPQLYVQDGAMQEWSTDLYDGAMTATKAGNLAAAVKLKNAADMISAKDKDLQHTEGAIEEEYH